MIQSKTIHTVVCDGCGAKEVQELDHNALGVGLDALRSGRTPEGWTTCFVSSPVGDYGGEFLYCKPCWLQRSPLFFRKGAGPGK